MDIETFYDENEARRESAEFEIGDEWTDAAGLADGAKREAQTFAKSQLERVMSGMDLVSREEFEAVRDMAAMAREENERLEKRIAELEAKLKV